MDETTTKVDPGAKKKSKVLERRHGGSKCTAENQVAPNTHIDSSQAPGTPAPRDPMPLASVDTKLTCTYPQTYTYT